MQARITLALNNPAQSTATRLDVSKITAGVYFVEILTATGKETHKVLIGR